VVAKKHVQIETKEGNQLAEQVFSGIQVKENDLTAAESA
jgi:hypothetical protein